MATGRILECAAAGLARQLAEALEHTNLGAVTLTDLGHDHTRVAHSTEHPEQERLAPLLDVFGRQIQSRFQVEAGGADHTP